MPFAYPRANSAFLSLRIGLQPRVAHADDLVRQVFDLLPRRLRHRHIALVGQKAVMRVVGRIQQVLVVQLAEDRRHQHVVPGHRLLRMLLRHLVEGLQRAVIVQVVELLVPLAHQRVEVQRIGMHAAACAAACAEHLPPHRSPANCCQQHTTNHAPSSSSLDNHSRAQPIYLPTQLHYTSTHALPSEYAHFQLLSHDHHPQHSRHPRPSSARLRRPTSSGRRRSAAAEVEKTRLDYLRERSEVIYDNLRDLKFEFRAGKYPEDDYLVQRRLARDRSRRRARRNGRTRASTLCPIAPADPCSLTLSRIRSILRRALTATFSVRTPPAPALRLRRSPAFAANLITGTVTNRTNGKPSAGDDVVLIRLQQTMQETTRTKTDAHGHFTLEVPDDGMHLVRVTHDKATYFQPVQPGTNTVDIDVYDAAPKIDGVTTAVEELHVEATATELHIVEVLQVINNSTPARTQFGPAGFDFYVPPAAAHPPRRRPARRHARADLRRARRRPRPLHLPLPHPPRRNAVRHLLHPALHRPANFDLRLAAPVNTVAVLMPRSMTFKAGASTPWQVSRDQGEDPATQTWVMQNVSPRPAAAVHRQRHRQHPRPAHQRSQRRRTGRCGSRAAASPNGQPLPETQNTAPGRGLQNPLDPEGERDPWGKYKWWILGLLGLLLAAAAGVLLRKPKEDAGLSLRQAA